MAKVSDTKMSMADNSSAILLELSELDRKIVLFSSQRQTIESARASRNVRLGSERTKVVQLKSTLEKRSAAQLEEERALKEAERKIVERRRALTHIPGAKAAKIAEREIDIETRSIQQREEKLLKAMEEVEAVKKDLGSAEKSLGSLEAEEHSAGPEESERLVEVAEQLRSLQEKRQMYLKQLEPTLLKLYDRVRAKYPSDPVAVAQKGSCSVCCRTMPPQLFNEVLKAEKVLQCPGCSRIMVAAPPEPAP